MTLGRVEDFDKSQVDDIVSALEGYTDKIEVLESIDDCHHEWCKNYGDVFVMEKLWAELKLDQILNTLLQQHEYEFDVISALKAMVFNRAINALSKLSTYDWLQNDVYFPAADNLDLHHLYRGLDFLIEHKDEIEAKIYDNLKNLFSLDVTVVFYDCSLVDMYGESSNLIQYSRKGKTQFLLSFVLSRDGLPISHEVLPGNIADISTVIKAMNKLKERFSVGRCIFVGDRGMVSQEKLEQLENMNYDYIVGVRLNQWKEVKEQVLTTPGRYTKVKDNMQVKEAYVNDKRYLICYNPYQAQKDKETREAVVEYLQAEITDLNPDTKKAAALYGHRYKGRYLRKLKDGTLKIDRMQIREDEKYDGKYILLTSDEDLEKEEIATTFKRLTRIERSFRSLKSLHDLEPVFHSVDRRIKAHVFVCILAHLLERLLEQKMETEDLEITAAEAIKRLGRMKVTKTKLKDKEYLIRTDSTSEINEIFKALHYQPPSRVEIIS
ncbi:MAG: IS1634 family transposase [Halanaerobiales bacterium]|nr:IS1634 family transposase [Halanaerobiales bacterium]